MHKEMILFMFRQVNKRVQLGLTRIWPTERNNSVIKSLGQLKSTPMTNLNFCKNESQKSSLLKNPLSNIQGAAQWKHLTHPTFFITSERHGTLYKSAGTRGASRTSFLHRKGQSVTAALIQDCKSHIQPWGKSYTINQVQF